MKSNISLKVSTSIQASATEVWEALTQPEMIKQYFFGTDTYTDWKPGHPIQFKGEWKGKQYEDKGTILEVVENKRIRYNYWSSLSGIEDIPENYVPITYEINEEEGKVNLTVTQENIPDEQMKAHSKENWKLVLEGLKNLVEKKNELTI